jgi:hypothetical protein
MREITIECEDVITNRRVKSLQEGASVSEAPLQKASSASRLSFLPGLILGATINNNYLG